MKPLLFILTCMMVLLTGTVSAQETQSNESVFTDYLNVREPAGFLRIPGLEFSSSMGFSYFSSNDFGSGGMGYYLGHFNLALSSSLTLHADIGLSSMVTGPDAYQSPQLFVPNIDLTYRPSDSFMMKLQFHQYRQPTGLMWRRYR
jgi:hypothetical protein